MSSFYSSSTLSVSVKNLLWLILTPTTRRIQIVTEGKKRKLIIKDCKIDDTANITVKVPGDESSAPLKVARKSTNTDLDTKLFIFHILQRVSKFSIFWNWANPFPSFPKTLPFLSHNILFLLHSECTTGAEYLFSIYTLTPHPK